MLSLYSEVGIGEHSFVLVACSHSVLLVLNQMKLGSGILLDKHQTWLEGRILLVWFRETAFWGQIRVSIP